MGFPNAPLVFCGISNGDIISATGHTIHFMFGSMVEFSGSANRMALLRKSTFTNGAKVFVRIGRTVMASQFVEERINPNEVSIWKRMQKPEGPTEDVNKYKNVSEAKTG